MLIFLFILAALASSLLRLEKWQRYMLFQFEQRRSCQQSRMLVYRCSLEENCGGTGDRFVGMISSFAAAILTNRAFFINVSFFDHAFQPAFIDWKLNRDIENCMRGARVLNLINARLSPPNPSTLALESIYGTDDRLIVQSNRGYLCNFYSSYSINMALREYGIEDCKGFGQLFDLLFDQTPILSRSIRELAMPPNYVTVHYRRMNDFSFGENPPPLFMEEVALIKNAVDCARKIALRLGNGTRIAMFSDGMLALTAATAFDSKIIKSIWVPQHVSLDVFNQTNQFSADRLIAIQRHAFAEWVAITRSRAIVALAGRHSSGYVRTAGFVSLGRGENSKEFWYQPETCDHPAPDACHYCWIAAGV